jgi:nucleoside-diphosphate-sugar epimerase
LLVVIVGVSVKKRLTFLITGGAGFLGHNLARFLLNKGNRVRTIDLAPFDYPGIESVEHFQWDIRNKAALRKAAQGADVIVHAAAGLPLWKPDEIKSVNVLGTRAVLDVALELGISRVVHISTTAVYGIPDHHPLYETDRLQGVGPYGQSKVAAEKICEAYRRRLCVPILRPKSFIGQGRLGVFDVLFDWIRRGKNIPLVGWGNNLYQLLHVEDLNEAILLAATKPAKIANNTFNIGAATFGTMRQDYQALLDYAGFGKRVVGTPPWLVIPALRVLEALRLSPLYKWVYETADKDSFVSIEKAQKVLGWQPTRSNVDALIDSYDWYLNNYKEYQGKSGVTHRVPWKQGILALIRAFF